MTRHVAIPTLAGPIREFRFEHPADRVEGEGYVYVLGFDSQTVKVGYTMDPQRRIARHASTAAVHGAAIRHLWLSGPHADPRINEQALIDFCGARATARIGSEYFAGVQFAEVVECAGRLDYVRLAIDLPARQRAVRDAEMDAYWGSQIRERQAVLVPSPLYAALCDAAKEADMQMYLLEKLIGPGGLSQQRLPARLRRAADRLKTSPDLIDRWKRLFPKHLTDEIETPLPAIPPGEAAAGQTPVAGGVAPTTAPVARGWAADPSPGSAAPESP
jgi:hypothetical protein